MSNRNISYHIIESNSCLKDSEMMESTKIISINCQVGCCDLTQCRVGCSLWYGIMFGWVCVIVFGCTTVKQCHVGSCCVVEFYCATVSCGGVLLCNSVMWRCSTVQQCHVGCSIVTWYHAGLGVCSCILVQCRVCYP